MRFFAACVFTIGVFVACIGGMVAAQPIPYNSGTVLTPEENRRLAQEQRENWDKIMEEIDKSLEEYDRRFKEIMEATKDQRDAYDAKLDAFVRANPKPGYGTEIFESIGEDGLYEYATVYYVDDRGNGHFKAEFDKDGNTTGIVQTADGKAMQNARAYIENAFKNDPENKGVGSWESSRDIYGNTYLSHLVVKDRQGHVRVDAKFNEKGIPYQTDIFNENGQRVGSGYHPEDLPVTEDKGSPLETVALVRLVTQPCEPCRGITEWRNNLAREMNAIAADMNNVAQMHKIHKGAQQPPLRMRHEHLIKLWKAYKAEFDKADAQRRECEKRCTQRAQTAINVAGSPVEVCAAQATSAKALEDYAKKNKAQLGSVTKLPQGGVEGELRLPAKDGNACGALPSSGTNVTIIEKVPCTKMADDVKPPVSPWARSVGRNSVEGQVARGRDFSGKGTAVIDRAHASDTQVENFLTGIERAWRPGDAKGPNVTRLTPDGKFRLPVSLCPPGSGPKKPLSERISLGSLSTVDFDRVQTGVNTGLTAGSVLEKLEYLKYKYENGLEITAEEIGGLVEDLNTLRGDRFEKLGTVLDGLKTNVDRYEKIKGVIEKGHEILDFIDLASRGRDDPVVAAEALSKYLNLVGDLAGKVPSMGEFVQMYAQGVEGMVDNLKVIQRQHNMTVNAINDIEQFTNDFYGTDVSLDDAAPPTTSTPRPPTKEEIDAINRYRATRQEARSLENATADLRSLEDCIENCQSETAATLHRISDLEDERKRMGTEQAVWHDYDAKRRLHAWYQKYVRENGPDATPTTQPEANWWLRGRNITERHVLDARDRLRRWRAIGPIIDGLYADIEKIAKRLEDCEKRLPQAQQAYLVALRAYVEKDSYYRGLSQGLSPQEATNRARQIRDQIPATPPQSRTRIAEPQGGGCATTVTFATSCEESSVLVSDDPRDTGQGEESLQEWIKRNSPPVPEDSALLHEYDPSEDADLNFDFAE